jgi:chemotaxis methyl-accepting protein methylase
LTQKKPGPERNAEKTPVDFPVVGIGASAGGLETLELFLANVPKASGMAFVIVQHLDPTHKGLMAELLQRSTDMPVRQAEDGMQVQADCVYVIPPNRDLSILRGALHLLDPVEPRGLRLPIDFFFRALADDRRERCIGVILSGMGSDGTMGLRAIKEKAGAVFVQEPSTAKFDGMPRSAVDAGLADMIAPVEELPGRIAAFLRQIPLIAQSKPSDPVAAQTAFDKVVILLRQRTGHDFSMYKKSTLNRRIERQMGLHQISRITDYCRFMQENPQEAELLFRELLIGVTRFFRDPEAWAQVKSEVLPELLARLGANQVLRAWIPACSTGEEAYSLAILFKEALEELESPRNAVLQIFATDLDPQSITLAREGAFPANITADVSARRLERYFIRTDRGYRAGKSIRETIVFAPQNIIMDPPFTKIDLLFCRNLLIYLTPELQHRLLSLFHYSMNPGGILFLGNAETVGDLTDRFQPLSGKSRLYRRIEGAPEAEPVEFPTFFTVRPFAAEAPRNPAVSLQATADQLLLQKYSPAAVLTTEKGDILYISGRTGKFLEPAAGKANWNVFVMAREGLRRELTVSFQRALRQRAAVTIENLAVESSEGKQAVKVTIQPLGEADGLRQMVMIVFAEIAEPPAAKPPVRRRGTGGRRSELERELESAREDARSMREEMQTSQEELKSANEELQSMNEELQSTNEELTTSKEELQAMNEELHTVNQEMQSRLDDFSRLNNDMKNLLDSTDIAMLFLDNGLCVRRFTNETSKITALISTDVGRPVTDIASALLYPELAEDAHQVLRSLVKTERQIRTPDGNWYLARIAPYRTLDNVIDGVSIMFMDITAFKRLETELIGRGSGT